MRTMLVASDQPSVLVVVGDAGKVYTSTDAGQSFTNRTAALLASAGGWSSLDIQCVVWMADRARIWLGGTAGAYAYSDDYGATWTTGSQGTADIRRAAYNPATGVLVIATNTTTGLRSSTNGGTTFSTPGGAAATTPSRVRFVGGNFVATPTGITGAVYFSALGTSGWASGTGNGQTSQQVTDIEATATRLAFSASAVGRIGNSLVPNSITYSNITGEPASLAYMASDGTVLVWAAGAKAISYLSDPSGVALTAATVGGSMPSEAFAQVIYSPKLAMWFAVSINGWLAYATTHTTWSTILVAAATMNDMCVCDAA